MLMDAPELVEVDPGKTAEITVSVFGYPEPVVEWYKSNQLLIPGEKYQVCPSSLSSKSIL